jgi:hypothetical protein
MEEHQEVRSPLVAYLNSKVTFEAINAIDEGNHTADAFEKWKQDHFRKGA